MDEVLSRQAPFKRVATLVPGTSGPPLDRQHTHLMINQTKQSNLTEKGFSWTNLKTAKFASAMKKVIGPNLSTEQISRRLDATY